MPMKRSACCLNLENTSIELAQHPRLQWVHVANGASENKLRTLTPYNTIPERCVH